MNNTLSLRPVYVASLSGGKDSLFMFGYILSHLDKYPLDYVVHFDLEIDYPIFKNVINDIEKRCNKLNIPFLRFSPRVSFDTLYQKWGYPTSHTRWCNGKYKLDCQRQLIDFLKSFNCRPIMYVGFCADETKRFKYTIGDYENSSFIYPLAEEGISEDYILKWASNQDIFQGFYRIFRRQGCMGCPNSSMLDWAYLRKYFRSYYDKVFFMIAETEKRYNNQYFYYPLEEFDNILVSKYYPILSDKEQFHQETLIF